MFFRFFNEYSAQQNPKAELANQMIRYNSKLDTYRESYQSYSQKPLIIHSCHHKTGTVVIEKILRTICQHLGLKYQYCKQSQLEPDTDVWLEHHSHIDFNAINRPIKGTHMIRNPCAIIISAYEYHKSTIEPWANRKIKALNNITYRGILNQLPEEEGIIFEMKNEYYLESSMNTIMDIYNWDYRRPEFLEVKYEDLMSNYDLTLSNMFKHYGWSREWIETGIRLAQPYNLRNKNKDELIKNKHVTNKNMDLNKWKEYFKNPNLASKFSKLYPDDIFQKIGYADDNIYTMNVPIDKTIEDPSLDEIVIPLPEKKVEVVREETLKEKLWKRYGGDKTFQIA